MSVRVLFVCLGNICRSPAAECVMNHLLKQENLAGEFECDSAGTAGYHIGNSPDARMAQVLRQRGIEVTGAARKVRREDLADFDLILAMDRANLADLVRLDSGGKYRHKIRMFGEYCKQTPGAEIPDPYYGGEEGFKQVVDMLQDGCKQLLETLRKK